jgi:ABC-type multidrug transport system ATPase subunit
MEPRSVSEGMQAHGVIVSLGGRRVLDGVSLSVPRAQVTGLLARSGAGKSTLLRTLVRLIEADAGEITLDGEDILELDACILRRRVGLVAQTPAMLPGTVEDNLRHGVDGLSDGDVREALSAASLDESFADRIARELSGGERARVALARALTRGPELLLLDEPTAALDASAAEHIGQTLRGLRDRGLGICVATHDQSFVEAWVDRREQLR